MSRKAAKAKEKLGKGKETEHRRDGAHFTLRLIIGHKNTKSERRAAAFLRSTCSLATERKMPSNSRAFLPEWRTSYGPSRFGFNFPFAVFLGARRSVFITLSPAATMSPDTRWRKSYPVYFSPPTPTCVFSVSACAAFWFSPIALRAPSVSLSPPPLGIHSPLSSPPSLSRFSSAQADRIFIQVSQGLP